MAFSCHWRSRPKHPMRTKQRTPQDVEPGSYSTKIAIDWVSLSQGARESHADYRIIAEGVYQNNGHRRRRRDRWPRPGRQSRGLQAPGSEETDTGRRSVPRPPKGEPSVRCLSVFRFSRELRSGRGRDQRGRLVPHVYDFFPPRSRRAHLDDRFHGTDQIGRTEFKTASLIPRTRVAPD